MYEPLAETEVVYAGQPVALVVAETEAIAEDGAQLVGVELEPLEPVLDLVDAAQPGASRARLQTAATGDDAGTGDAHAAVAAASLDGEQLSDNVLDTARLASGDVEAALAASAHVVSGEFRTPWVYQGYLETQSAVAWVESEGELNIRSSSQAPFATRDALARLFGLPIERVGVKTTTLGGAFGGKIMLIDPLVAAAAMTTRRPVSLSLTRSEDLSAANPAPAERISITVGADADGKLTAIRARVHVDRGATDDMGVESIAAMLVAGPYRWPAYELAALGIATNRVTFGAYRAPSAPPAAFAVESLIDELATALGIDPLKLRLDNVIDEGDVGVTGQSFPVFGARVCLERVGSHPVWTSRSELPAGEGVGLSIGWWPGGYEPAAAACRLDADGNLTVITGAADMTGVETVFAAIAADAFGVDPSKVRVSTPTRQAHRTPAPAVGRRSPTQSAERSIRPRSRLASNCSTSRPRSSRSAWMTPSNRFVGHVIQPVGVPDKAMPIERIAAKVLSFAARTYPSKATAAAPNLLPRRSLPTSPMSGSTPTRVPSL